MNLTAILGKAHITVDEFLKLNVGDVVALESKTTDAVTVLAEDQKIYYARPGIVKKSRGIEILDMIDKDVESYE